jgi:membrane-bound ClpP family serine protease
VLPFEVADARFALAIAGGIALIVLARWAAHRGARWESWLAIRIGNVLFTEVIGAVLVGYGVGLAAEQLVAGSPTGPGRIVFPGRFGFGPRLPATFAILGGAIAVLIRLDLSDLLLRGSAPRGGLSTYIGWDGKVVVPIRAGEFGQIQMRDGMGYPVAAVATADTDLAPGTPVRVVGTKGVNLVVAPISSG